MDFLGARSVRVLAIILVVVVVLALRNRRRGRRPTVVPHPGPMPPRFRTPPPVPQALKRPTVNAGQLIVSLIFSPIVILFWALASIGDIVAIPIHLVIGTALGAVSLIIGLVGGTPQRLWRASGRQFTMGGKAGLSMLVRLMSYFGLAGVLDRVKESIRDEPVAPAPVPVRAARTTSKAYPFEERYRIESHLGSGGSTARLFVVRRMQGMHPVGDRLVLKYFDMGLGSRLEEVIRESRGMQVAKDMGIVIDHSLAEDHFFYVMPYYEGETLTRSAARLHRHLAADEGLPSEHVGTCLRWMSELLRILDGYHRHGVIHKDVKPDNVIVTDRGIRLVDLGLLTPLASALTLTTHGTEYFRDPEMVKLSVQGKRVKDVDAVRFDVYSAGAVLYYILEGSFPACGPLSRFSKPVPMALSWVTSRAMAEGGKRYPSIAAMRADLEAVIRLSGEVGLEAIPASRLPSFGGFDAAEAAAPEPPARPPMPSPRQNPPPLRMSPPPLRRPAPIRRQIVPTPPGSSRLPIFLAGLVLMGLVLLGLVAVAWNAAGASEHRIDSFREAAEWRVKFEERLEAEVEPIRQTFEIPAPDDPHRDCADVVVSSFLQWREGVGSELARTGELSDLRQVPVLLVSDGAAAPIATDIEKALAHVGVPLVEGHQRILKTKVRDLLEPGVSAEAVHERLLEVNGTNTIPIVIGVRAGRLDSGERTVEIGFFYFGFTKTRTHPVPQSRTFWKGDGR